MVYSAVGLAVLGAAVGLAFRWKVLLPFIVVLPFVAIPFLVSRGLSYSHAAIAVIVAEAGLQGGYFVGLLTRFVGTRLAPSLSCFKRRRDPKALDRNRQATPPAGAAKGS